MLVKNAIFYTKFRHFQSTGIYPNGRPPTTSQPLRGQWVGPANSAHPPSIPGAMHVYDVPKNIEKLRTCDIYRKEYVHYNQLPLWR